MKAFLIDPTRKNIEAVDIANGLDDVKKLIGFDTVDSDEIDSNGDRLYFDEECFLRREPCIGRFKVDSLAPVAGKGLIVGTLNSGAAFKGVEVTAETLAKRVTFL